MIRSLKKAGLALLASSLLVTGVALPWSGAAAASTLSRDEIWLQAYPKLDARSLVWWFNKVYGPGDYGTVLVPPGTPLLTDRQLKGRQIARDELAGMFALVAKKEGVEIEPFTYIPDLINAQPWLYASMQDMVDLGLYRPSADGLYHPSDVVTPNEIRAWRYMFTILISGNE